jgi:alpha-L-fucosidase
MAYTADWESIDSRPCPAWFGEAKFGIFIHWGPYSVPAWAPKGQYAEWYWSALHDRESETSRFHARQYGEGFQYQDFVPRFNAGLFDPDQWVDLFARAGARYVLPTSKHHDGFCLWPSAHSPDWNSVDVGPRRDLLGALTAAGCRRGLRMGLYYSLYEWYHPLYLSDVNQYVDQHMLPQLKDVVERYEPALIFTDGEWDHPSDTWRSCEFLAWLFDQASCRQEVVVNDRWGKETRSRHGGYFTTEYGEVGWGRKLEEGRVWEECRGIGRSFGYNRNEDVEDYLPARALVHLLIDTVSRGGNLNLNVGPTADGRIPVIMQERLLEIGEWLGVNGEAIYSTRPWPLEVEGGRLRGTAGKDGLFAICLDWPGRELILPGVQSSSETEVQLLGHGQPLVWQEKWDRLHIQVPALGPSTLPCRHAWVFKVRGAKARD